MKAEFTINKTTYTFNEITIQGYYELKAILLEETPEAKFKIVEILTKCPVSELRRLKNLDWLVIWAEASSLINTLAGLDATSIKPTIEFNSIKYGLPTPETMTIGEFADLEILFTADDFQKRLHEAAAILYRPLVNSDGEIEEYDANLAAKRSKAFLDLPISALRSANAFFFQYGSRSVNNTLASLMEMEEVKEMISPKDLELLKSLQQQEFIGASSMHWLEKTLSDLVKQQHSNYTRLLTGSLGEFQKTRKKKSFWQRVQEETARIKSEKNKTHR